MSRLWLKVIRDHRIRENLAADCAWGEEKNALVEMCKQADLPCPMWLNKHESEFERFRRTAINYVQSLVATPVLGFLPVR